jgi:hypothetical protein
MIFSSYLHTERRGQVVNTPASYSGGPGFKLGLKTGSHDWGFFEIFLSSFKHMSG